MILSGDWQLTFFFFPLLLGALLSSIFAWLVWRQKTSSASRYLAWLNIAVSLWSLSYIFELGLVNPPAKTFWLQMEYIGITTIPVFWLLFCKQYTKHGKQLSKHITALLFFLPAITLGLVFTNRGHHLIWQSIIITRQNNLSIFHLTYGAWFWLHTAYSYSLFFIGLYFLVQNYFQVQPIQRRQVGAVILAAVIPGLSNVLYLTDLNPYPDVDLTSLSFAITGVIIIRTLFYKNFLNIVPIGREMVFENMSNGFMVINLDGLVVDHNPAMETILDMKASEINGTPAAALLDDFLDGKSLDIKDLEQPHVVDRTQSRHENSYQIKISPLKNGQQEAIGHLVVFHDISETLRLNQDLQDQASRLTVLYEVGKAISTTIEIDDLVELIYEQLTRVIPSDAYFVAMYLPESEELDLRIIIDKGIRFPRQQIPADRGLSSWVVKNKQPLLIHDLKKEIDTLPIKPIMMGEKQLSRSWLGVPLLLENQLLGIIAVTSYAPDMFDRQDQLLLMQIAHQASLSIDNARHHQDVERQARLDSLTGVSNHSHFIQQLYQEQGICREQQKPLSLIMLDIDYFKQYNDTYGHVIGDQVLKLTVQAIQSHIKKTDIIGRWGGEEFAILLPNATTAQANMVANRIRDTLSQLPLADNEGKPIPKPTISQGIATIPVHTDDVDNLVIIADRALYRAKEKGRDQVAVGLPSRRK